MVQWPIQLIKFRVNLAVSIVVYTDRTLKTTIQLHVYGSHWQCWRRLVVPVQLDGHAQGDIDGHEQGKEVLVVSEPDKAGAVPVL